MDTETLSPRSQGLLAVVVLIAPLVPLVTSVRCGGGLGDPAGYMFAAAFFLFGLVALFPPRRIVRGIQ